jgi:hypothetical protein
MAIGEQNSTVRGFQGPWTCDVIYDELPAGPGVVLPVSSGEYSAPLIPVLVKQTPAGYAAHTLAGGAPENAETQVVQMSLLKDLKHRLAKYILSAEELSNLAPEMADDGNGACHPQCLVCLEELGEGQSMSRPACGHTFHHECMSAWLVSQLASKQVGACPHCKHVVFVPVIKCAEPPREAEVAGRTPRPHATRRTSSRPGCFSMFTGRAGPVSRISREGEK